MYRSKRIESMVKECLSGTLSCDNQGNIYRKGKIVKEHIDHDGYRAIYTKGMEIPCHQVIAYLKFKDSAIQKGIQTRHLNRNKLDNSWDNLEIGTHTDNARDIPKEVRSQIAYNRWKNKTAEERREITLKSAQSTSIEKRKLRSIKGSRVMTFEDRRKGHRTRKIILSDELKNQIFYLRDEFSINQLSIFFDLPVSQISKIIYAGGLL